MPTGVLLRLYIVVFWGFWRLLVLVSRSSSLRRRRSISWVGDRPTLKLQLDQVGFEAFSMTLQQLEARLASLEGDLAQVKLLLQQVLQGKAIELIQTEIPWWEKIAGTFEDDEAYDEAMRLGREWRNAQKDNFA
jgi:hypothetical protein